LNCDDHSDEARCEYLHFEGHQENYAKELSPKYGKIPQNNPLNSFLRLKDNQPVQIDIEFEILDIASVDVVNLKFTVDFVLTATWCANIKVPPYNNLTI